MLWPVVACALLWMSVGLFGHEPFKPDEAYTVGLVKSVVDSGDWVVPRLVGEPFMEKPPLFFDTAALFVKALPWLPLHEAARVAVLLFVGLGLLAIGAAARSVYGEGRGRLAVLLTLATVGAVVRLHQLITDTALFAGMAIGLLGLVRVPDAPWRGGMLVGAGVAIAFLSKGLLGPGLLLCTAAALACIRPWRGRPMATAAVVALLVATPPIAAWLAALELQAPDQMRVWFWDNNIGRFVGLNALGPKQDPFFYLGTLSWYALPCWPLALWGLVGRGGETGSRAGRDVLAPLLFLLIGLAVLSAASDGRELYALVLVPALALLATGGLLRLSPRVERRAACGGAAGHGPAVAVRRLAADLGRCDVPARLFGEAAGGRRSAQHDPAVDARDAGLRGRCRAVAGHSGHAAPGRPRVAAAGRRGRAGAALGINRAALERPAGRAEGRPRTGNDPQGTPAWQLLCG